MRGLAAEAARLRAVIAHAGSAGPGVARSVQSVLDDANGMSGTLLAGVESALTLVRTLEDACWGLGSRAMVLSAVEAAARACDSVDAEFEARAHEWSKALGKERRRGMMTQLKATFGVKPSIGALFKLRSLCPGSPSDEFVVARGVSCQLALTVRGMIEAARGAAAAVLTASPHAPGWLGLSQSALGDSATLEALRALRQSVEKSVNRALRARSKGWMKLGSRSESLAKRLTRQGKRAWGVFARLGEFVCTGLAALVPVLHAYVVYPLRVSPLWR